MCDHVATVPVTMGSPSFRRRDLGPLQVTDARFAARDVLAMHAHERTIAAFMFSGGFDVSFNRQAFDCGAGSTFVEPAGDRHQNRIGAEGARVLVFELTDANLAGDLRRYRRHLSEPGQKRRPDLMPLAGSLLRRLADGDDAGPEALAWELLSRMAEPKEPRRPGRWAEQVRDVLHANLDRSVRIGDLARDLGIHRVHLGRVFRARFGEALGDYHRRIRIEWAAGELAGGHASIGDVALRAGFADQAHFTRFFKRQMGATPSAWTKRLQPF